MAHSDRPTVGRPDGPGWYVVWRRTATGRFVRSVHFCARKGEVLTAFEAPLYDDELSRHGIEVDNPKFATSLWHGPFPSRRAAASHIS